MTILNVTDQNINEVVIGLAKMVIDYYYSDWCGPCRMLSPV
ncbi:MULTISPECIES: thioredoxin family protein [unclassified Paenibacillus]